MCLTYCDVCSLISGAKVMKLDKLANKCQLFFAWERSLHKPEPFEHRKWLEGLLTFARTTHLKQVSSFTLGKKQNDFCQVKFNESGHNFNINAYGGSMVICSTIHSTIKSPWIHHLHLIAIATRCYILLHHRYMLLLTCIIVTCCYSTPLLIDTSFTAILTRKDVV